MSLKYSQFLENESDYVAAELYWDNLFQACISNLGVESQWEEWFENKWGDGSKRMDGNPIFTRLDSSKNKALRVIQEEPESEDDKHISAWLDKFDDSIDELVISCVLSEEVELIVKDLFKYYLMDNSCLIETQSLIDKLIPAVNPE